MTHTNVSYCYFVVLYFGHSRNIGTGKDIRKLTSKRDLTNITDYECKGKT